MSATDEDNQPSRRLPGSNQHPVDYLAYVGSSAIGRAVDFMLAHRSKPPVLHRVFASHLAGVLKTMALEGRGLAWLPENEIATELQNGTLVISGDQEYFIPVEIRLFRSRETMSPAGEEFWAALNDA